MSALVASKAQELLDYARSKYQDELSHEDVSIGANMTVHTLSLNGVDVGLAVGQHVLGVHVQGTDLLHEARGACIPLFGGEEYGFLVFGAHDLAGQLVDPFFVRVYEDGNPQFIVGEDQVEKAEALFRMFLTLAIGW